MKTSCSFTKNNLKSFFRPGWKGMGDPGVEEVETRICTSPSLGSPWCLHPGLKRLSKPFWAKEKPVLMKNEAILTCFASIPGRFLFLLLIDTQNIIVFFP